MQYAVDNRDPTKGGQSVVLNRKDSRLINADELAQLRERAQDGVDMRAALNSLSSKRLEKLEVVRVGVGTQPVFEVSMARGWLEFESDLGDALLRIRQQREGDIPSDDGVPF